MKIEWTNRGLNRAIECAEFIGPDHAGKWLDELFAKVERLEEFPSSGRVVPELQKENYREILFGEYRIIYKIQTKNIFILTIRHNRQNLSADDI